MPKSPGADEDSISAFRSLSDPRNDSAHHSGRGVISDRMAARLFRLLGWSVLAAVALICVVPIVVIVIGSFSEGNPFNDFHGSLDPWRRAFESVQTLRAIGYSFLLSLRVPVGLAISFVIAWYLARNDVFGKRTIMYALWLAFFLPIVPATLGWILLLDPNYGIINAHLRDWLSIRGHVFDIYYARRHYLGASDPDDDPDHGDFDRAGAAAYRLVL